MRTKHQDLEGANGIRDAMALMNIQHLDDNPSPENSMSIGEDLDVHA